MKFILKLITSETLIVILFLTIIVVKCESNKTYYVEPPPIDNMNPQDEDGEGTPTNPFHFIQSAVSVAKGGDIIYIKRGIYSRQNIKFSNGGNKDKDIFLMGVDSWDDEGTTTPVNFNFSGLNASWDHTQIELQLPCLDAEEFETNSQNTAIDLNGQSNINLSSLVIKNYTNGILSEGNDLKSNNIHIQNVIGVDFGYIGSNGKKQGIKYAGRGITIYGSNNKIENCTVFDAGAENISVFGDYNSIINSRAFGTDCKDATDDCFKSDYYILTNGTSNEIVDCKAECIYEVNGAHGIGTTSGQANYFKSNEAVGLNECFFVKSGAVISLNNKFENCVAKYSDGSAFVLREGASYNTFENCESINTIHGVRFLDSCDPPNCKASSHNKFINCRFCVEDGFSNSRTIIQLSRSPYNTEVSENIFDNCQFIGNKNITDHLICAQVPNSKNKIINSTIDETLVEYNPDNDVKKICIAKCNLVYDCFESNIQVGEKCEECEDNDKCEEYKRGCGAYKGGFLISSTEYSYFDPIENCEN